ncbi:putative 3-methyladenine DNA glycosylase [Porphyridium purpureum]|uniref:DNA-3-methyladenine glycosylase II n=1 Tax=Porphyridium purpureum TaxID=35688 RepID=A0A5J4YYI4_PORPP|nr:putative 3-methyladenine DNA glycosylase [Porphyridium purpureum]|eukprot:POR6383..scf208_2
MTAFVYSLPAAKHVYTTRGLRPRARLNCEISHTASGLRGSCFMCRPTATDQVSSKRATHSAARPRVFRESECPRQMGSAAAWAWHSSWWRGDSDCLPKDFFLRDGEELAKALLGCRLRSTVDGETTEGLIVEVEAYVGPHDPASHAAARIGRTQRNNSMFGPPGTSYVYRIYGIHWCLNVVCREEGFPAAVLIRALEPTTGIEAMSRRRGTRTPLCSGPGRLCQALGITSVLDGHPFDSASLQLLEGYRVPEDFVCVTGRVGVSQAPDWPLRFYLRNHPCVSNGPHQLKPKSACPGSGVG